MVSVYIGYKKATICMQLVLQMVTACSKAILRKTIATKFGGGSVEMPMRLVVGDRATLWVDGRAVPIDTGFMVFNHVTYPNLVRLFATLGVPAKRTDMSFCVRHESRDFEFCGSSLNHLFAQRSNLLRPSFYRMLLQIDRFNREAVAALDDPAVPPGQDLVPAEHVPHQTNRRDNGQMLQLVQPLADAVGRLQAKQKARKARDEERFERKLRGE